MGGAGRVEAAIGTLAEPCDLSEGTFGDRVVPFLKHEARDPQGPELTGEVAQPVRVLFHAVTDKNQGVHPLVSGLLQGVSQDPFDLCVPRGTGDGRHLPLEGPGIGEPRARLELAVAPVEAQLDLETAERGRRLEHLGLDTAGAVPGPLTAGGRVHGEDEPAAPPGRLDP